MTAPHFDTEHVTVYEGDCIDVMRGLPDASVDAVVTDPPYGLEFMGKEWDSFKTYAGGNPAMKPQGANVGGDPSAASYGYRQKNPRCRNCGKLQRGNGACKCPTPSWDTRTSESAFQFQAWTEDWAREAWRLLKPGGHLLAFGGTRTHHRLAAGIEDAGFEIRDSIAWLYGSGFPKSHNVAKAVEAHLTLGGSSTVQKRRAAMGDDYERSAAYGTFRQVETSMENVRTTPPDFTATRPEAQQWQGWGTALKPAFEPVVVARKPLTGTVAANVLAYGTGALNIDASRIDASASPVTSAGGKQRTALGYHGGTAADGSYATEAHALGRWPANVILDASQATALDQQSGVQRDGVAVKRHGVTSNGVTGWGKAPAGTPDLGYGGEGGASRFFKTVDDVAPRFMYTAKAGSDERPGVDGVSHPTVKPVDLMRWLVKLVTPKGGTVLEPFAGSGTTVEAAVLEGFRCIAIEREADYLPLIMQRVSKPHAVGLDFGDWEDAS